MPKQHKLFKLDKTLPIWKFISTLNHSPTSDFKEYYQSVGNLSPWQSDSFKRFYQLYYMPLNTLRLISVIQEGQRWGFFQDLDTALDYGSGSGTFELAAMESQLLMSHMEFVESSAEAMQIHQTLRKLLPTPAQNVKWNKNIPGNVPWEKTLQVFSYSLVEHESIPKNMFRAEALLIMEPSTSPAARRLQELRVDLLDQGYSIWAPCTHEHGCPLLEKSGKDWCHQRIHIELPEPLQALHASLPIRNDTLTFSYLLARKKKPLRKPNQARIIGDTLFERGKVRQAICRGPEREFLSWLTKYGEPAIIPRGNVIEIADSFEKKGNEIRVKG